MKVKYPRTPHLPWSDGGTDDDKRLSSVQHFQGKEVVVTEKRDGENSTLMRDYTYARSLDSADHPSRHWLKGLWGSIRMDIPNDWRICGENLYARHSIAYNGLKSYFEVFSIWDENNVCLSFDDTVVWCQLLGLDMVPVLWRGIFDETAIRALTVDKETQEGYVVRLASEFNYADFALSVAKYVRKDHVQTDSHWMYDKIIPNVLVKS